MFWERELVRRDLLRIKGLSELLNSENDPAEIDSFILGKSFINEQSHSRKKESCKEKEPRWSSRKDVDLLGKRGRS